MPDPKDLVSPSGKPLIQERKVIVIKKPKQVRIHPQLYSDLNQMTGCAVLELPMDSEFMMGELAVKELESLHHGIHAILELPDAIFVKEELTVFYEALRYLCEKTAPGDNSKEVALLKKTKKLIQ